MNVVDDSDRGSDHTERRKLPVEREGATHRFCIAGHEGYITTGLYPDRRLGEVFLVVAKEGSTIRGLMDSIAMLISLALQYGVPVEAVCRMLRHQRFAPSGIATGISEITRVASLVDYVAAYLSIRYGTGEAAGLERDTTLDDTT